MAFWGSVAVLNGIVRYYLALTAVFVESTDTLILGFPIMIILFVSKWVGDKFTINIYTEHLKHQGLPLLPEEPPVFCDGILAKEVMSTPVLCLHRKERVANVYTALTNTRHKVFPIVDGYLDDWDLTGSELGMTIDCEHFMMKHPFFVTPDHPISKVYRLITGAGLRHIVVLDHDFQVRGIVSRCDLARYQEWHFWGNYGLHKVPAISS
ncbi:unnamed protein product [Notodromas monacha]|uniref:CBS domain-containing protein n=1 Tax=Notodromas monacha TaxID=399045 RepID=A0A7R9BHE9_9CRUS|nr:unnamed protein product [Notodromas monacha]CAG0915540.1 unnamed protein product [Notodromas monacha]